MGNQRKHVKVWTATRGGTTGFMITEKEAFLIGNRGNFVVADSNHVSITAKSISLNTASENIRNGGLFVKMNDLVQMVPTTIVTPMPAQIPWPPLAMITGILKDMEFFMGMLNVGG